MCAGKSNQKMHFYLRKSNCKLYVSKGHVLAANLRVLVVLGSISDADTVLKTTSVLDEFGVDYEAHVLSAHRSSEAALECAKTAKEKGFSVIICAAGMAAHLAGVFAANSTLPVIGLPLSGGLPGGLDALYATVQMPSGYPVATVAVDGAKNAAYLAISILALQDAELEQKLVEFRRKTSDGIKEKDAEFQQRLKGQN